MANVQSDHHSLFTPRFLKESDTGTDALPVVIESGKQEERALDYQRIQSLLRS